MKQAQIMKHCGSGVTVAAADLKSAGRNLVRVRVPPPAPTRSEHDIISEKIEKKSWISFQYTLVKQDIIRGVGQLGLLREAWAFEIVRSNRTTPTKNS